MDINAKFFWSLGLLSAFIILVSMKKSNHLFLAAFSSIIQGVSALFAVNLIYPLTGVSLAINWVSVAVSCVGGVFGVVFLLVSKVVLFV